MTGANQPAVVVKAYDFTLRLLPEVERFNRAYKFTIGDRLAADGMELLLTLGEQRLALT